GRSHWRQSIVIILGKSRLLCSRRFLPKFMGNMISLFHTLVAACFLFGASLCHGKESPWKILALNDLEEIRKAISENHPGVVDDKNPSFKRQFEQSYQSAEQAANKATSFNELYYLTKKFVNGFKDGHLSYFLTVQRSKLRWPEFLIAFRGNGFVVHSISEQGSMLGLPQKGEELISCNGKSPAAILKENV